MASVKLSFKNLFRLGKIQKKGLGNVLLKDSHNITSDISEKRYVVLSSITDKQNTNSTIKYSSNMSTIQEILPFRIRLTAVRIPSGGPLNTPPIPLQIIGFSNYIL